MARKVQRVGKENGSSYGVPGASAAAASKDSLYALDAPAAPSHRIPATAQQQQQAAAGGGYDRYGEQGYSRSALPAW